MIGISCLSLSKRAFWRKRNQYRKIWMVYNFQIQRFYMWCEKQSLWCTEQCGRVLTMI